MSKLVRLAQVAGVSAALLTFATLSAGIGVTASHNADPTFAEDVAPIFYKNCTMCHRPGGQAPFSLIDLDSADLSNMAEAVSKGTMPPWYADGPQGVFKNDRRISAQDKQTILRWLETGAKPGDRKKLPARPVYTSDWEMGEPDMIVKMPEDYVVPAAGVVEYQYFEVPTNLTEEKWVQSIEIMPGAREVVHHVLVYAKVPPAALSVMPAITPAPAAVPGAAPAARPTPVFIRNRNHGIPPDPPRQDVSHPPPRPLGNLIGSTAVGSNMVEFPPGTALRLRPGTVLVFQMHYTPHGHEMKDRSAVGFRFAKQEPTEEIFTSNFVNGSFTIPAGAKDVSVPSELGIGQAVKIYALLPHTHLRGVRWQYTLQKPDSSTEVILDVPRYDFNWQIFYMFNKPLELAPGSKINAMAWYDNSTANKSNPNPKMDVKWGDQTFEEMQYTGFIYSVPGRKIR